MVGPGSLAGLRGGARDSYLVVPGPNLMLYPLGHTGPGEAFVVAKKDNPAAECNENSWWSILWQAYVFYFVQQTYTQEGFCFPASSSAKAQPFVLFMPASSGMKTECRPWGTFHPPQPGLPKIGQDKVSCPPTGFQPASHLPSLQRAKRKHRFAAIKLPHPLETG